MLEINNVDKDLRMAGVQTAFDKDVFKRYMNKPIEAQKNLKKSNVKKFTITEKTEIADLLMINLSIINYDPKQIKEIFF